MSVDYHHATNVHSLKGARAALPLLLARAHAGSLLDVGCGTGTWMKAALDFGIADVFGIDGVQVPADQLHVPAEKIARQELSRPWNLGRRFDAVICLEVAEHLDRECAPGLIDSLARHADLVYFSAACPGQEGQHHVNCQWPAYWQQLFNARGFSCSDEPRWELWDLADVEPWYRQNLFVARRAPDVAGREPRIKPIIHPEMLRSILTSPEHFQNHVQQIEQGRLPASWYLKAPVVALSQKSKRRLS